MSWTYDATSLTDPTDGPLMQVRLAIGDTDTGDQQLQDEEIQYLLGDESNAVFTAAGRACQILAGKYARKANKKVGDLSIEYEKISKHYRDLADDFFSQALTHAVPTAGGVLTADRDANQTDSSVQHNFLRRGMHDFTPAPIIPNSQRSGSDPTDR